MRDPFRPNTDSQLVREAQFAFVVIAVLLCVLAYVAFHRVSGKKFHFRQIAQTAPLAVHVNDTAYPAQKLLDKESQFTQETLSTNRSIAKPPPTEQTNPASAATTTQTFSQRQKPAIRTPKQIPTPKQFRKQELPAPPVQAIETTSQEKVVASAAALPAQSVAQAQFIAPTKPAPAFQPIRQTKPTADEPAAVDPFEKIKSNVSSFKPVKPLPKMANDKQQDQQSVRSKPVVSGDTSGSFRPPAIKSDFGAGSTRELPSFDDPIKQETFKEARNPTPTQLRPALPQPRDDGFSIKRKTAADVAKTFSEIKPPVAKVTKTKISESKPQEPVKQQSFSADEYRVQKTDSLWSIAVDHYGDGRFFRALHKHNFERITSANGLEPNALIAVPKIDELLKRYPELCPADKLGASSASNGDDNALQKMDYDLYEESMDARFHVTESGDTLFDVARQQLGQASRYLEIFELNRFRIPQHVNHLTPLDPGLRLLLPE